MANTVSVLMTNILAGALDVLGEEMTTASLVTKDFRGVAGKKGETVSVSVPVAQTVGNVTPAATPPAFTDTVVTEKIFTLDQYKRTGFHLTERDAAKIVDGGFQFAQSQIGESARALAYDVNASILSKYKGIYGYAGTAGTNPFNSDINTAADARQVLNRQNCPDGARKMVLGYTAETAALKLSAFNNADKRGNSSTLESGQIGDLFGMKVFREGQIPTHTSTALTAGNATINGAHAAGVTTVSIAKASNSAPLVEGDIISFAGITGTYTVVTGVTLAVGNTNVTISPGLEQSAAGGEVMTLRATHVVNLAFDPAAFALAIRLPEDKILGMPTLGEHAVMVDPKTGIPLKLSYYPGYKGGQWELSLLYGSTIVDPRRACRIAG